MMAFSSGVRPARPMMPANHIAFRRLLPALAFGLIACGLLFHQEVVAAVQVWSASTAFSHCFVVLPLAAYLAWDRRRLAGLQLMRPMPGVALVAIPLTCAWFAADRLGIMEGRQLISMCCVELLFLAVLGWRLWAAFSAALLYLFFLVPFGAFVVPSLQTFTTDFITTGLSILGIPYYADAFTIEISAGTFYVAEACAGLRFLIAAIAFGVLYACLFYRSPWRRAGFIGASIVIPIIANGFRGLGIVVLGHVLGSAQAAAVDHVVYGWLFFSVVLFLMILGGLPFREDMSPHGAVAAARPTEQPGGMARALAAATAVVVLMAIGPLSALWLDRRAANESVSMRAPLFATGPDCAAVTAAQTDVIPGHPTMQHFICDGIPLTTLVEVFSPRTTLAVLQTALRKAAPDDDAEDTRNSTLVLDQGEPRRWQLIETGNPVRLTAFSSWIDGAPSSGGLQARLRQGWNSIVGAEHAPVVVTVTMEIGGKSSAGLRQERSVLLAFLQAQSMLAAQISEVSAVASRPANHD